MGIASGSLYLSLCLLVRGIYGTIAFVGILPIWAGTLLAVSPRTGRDADQASGQHLTVAYAQFTSAVAVAVAAFAATAALSAFTDLVAIVVAGLCIAAAALIVMAMLGPTHLLEHCVLLCRDGKNGP